MAQDLAQSQAFWRLRENISEAQRIEGISIKHDIAVPVSRIVTFGHIGDGNLHFNLSQPVGMSAARFLDQWETLTGLVNGVVVKHRGSISAEHGTGLLKRDALAPFEGPVAIDLMRRVKSALDPDDRLNPGKLLPP